MMDARSDRLVKGVSVGLTALILALSVAMPLMEQLDPSTGPVVESEHDPSTCPTGHDHTLCVQVGANASAPVDRATRRAPRLVRAVASPGEAPSVVSAAFTDGHPSRAPPTA